MISKSAKLLRHVSSFIFELGFLIPKWFIFHSNFLAQYNCLCLGQFLCLQMYIYRCTVITSSIHYKTEAFTLLAEMEAAAQVPPKALQYYYFSLSHESILPLVSPLSTPVCPYHRHCNGHLLLFFQIGFLCVALTVPELVL